MFAQHNGWLYERHLQDDSKAVPPLSKDTRVTENTVEIGVGEGVLWRSRVEPTSFKIHVADPVAGQVAIQTRLKIQGPRRVDRSAIEDRSRKDPGNRATVRPQCQRSGNPPLFVHDGTRRGAPADAPPGMIQNLITMETFGIRDGLIHEVEVFPFVTVPYGWGNGLTIGSGR